MHVLKGIKCKTEPSQIQLPITVRWSFVSEAFYWITFPPTHPGLFCMGVVERFIILVVLTVSCSLEHTSL